MFWNDRFDVADIRIRQHGFNRIRSESQFIMKQLKEKRRESGNK